MKSSVFFFLFWENKKDHSFFTTAQALKLTLIFVLFETRMESDQKKKTLEKLTLVNPLRLLEDGGSSVISAAS